MTARPSVCVLGLGLMGRPMARALLAEGFDVRGWNWRPPREPVEGLPLAATLEQAAGADVCLLILADSPAVDSVLAGLEPALRAGQVVLDMGTSEPARSRAHAERLAARGIGWVDAPVSGGPEGTLERRLAIMAGGAEADLDRAWPVLEALGNPVRVGGPGAGDTVKVMNQIIVGLTIEAVAEALALAERAGIDGRLVQEALAGGSADSRILHGQGTRMIEHAYVPGGRVATMLKDLRMALDLAKEVGARLPHTASTVAAYERLVARGEADLDCSALHKLLLEP